MKRFLSWNAIAFFLLALQSLLALPFFIRSLEPSDFARLSLLWSAVSVSTVLDLGVGRLLVSVLGDQGRNPQRETSCEVVSSGTAAAVLFASVAAFALWIGMEKYFAASGAAVRGHEVTFAAGAAFFGILTSAMAAAFEGILDIRAATFVRILNTMAVLAVPAALGAIAPSGSISASSVMLVAAIARLVVFVGAGLALYERQLLTVRGVRPKLIRRFAAQGKWLGLSSAVSVAMTHSDRFLLGYAWPPSVLVSYTAAAELVQRGTGILSIVSTASYPLLASAPNHKAQLHVWRRGFLLMTSVVIIGFVLGNLLVGSFVAIWLGSGYDDVTFLVRVMLFGWAATGLAQMYLAWSHSTGENRRPAIIHVLEAILFIPLTAFCVLNFGVTGAASAWSARAMVDALALRISAKGAFR